MRLPLCIGLILAGSSLLATEGSVTEEFTATAQPETERRWTGSAALNLSAIQSTRDSQFLSLSINAVNKGEKDKISAKAFYSFARQSPLGGGDLETTEDRYSLEGQYDYTIRDQTFWFAAARFDHDAVNDLDLRTIVTGGLGYMIIDREDTAWQVTGGISYRNEQYDGEPESSEVGLSVGSNYQRLLSRNLNLTHDLRFIPAFSDFGDYFLVSDLGLVTSLSERFSAEFRFIFDYDSTPATGAQKDNYKYFLGLGYKF